MTQLSSLTAPKKRAYSQSLTAWTHSANGTTCSSPHTKHINTPLRGQLRQSDSYVHDGKGYDRSPKYITQIKHKQNTVYKWWKTLNYSIQAKCLCKQSWLLCEKTQEPLCPRNFSLTDQIPQSKRRSGGVFRKWTIYSTCPLGVCVLSRFVPWTQESSGTEQLSSISSWNTRVRQRSRTGVWSFHLPLTPHLSEEAAGGSQTQRQTPEVQKASPV